ncbi:MAG: serine/threonine-protein kinase [Actinomycetota bacterium]|nr:serine/threonine-protein kinase [Actinomycetota bacterium]
MTLDRRAMEAALPAYEVGAELGRGSFGVVYRGTHKQLHRTVAIKQLPRALAADPGVQSRFLAEARTAAALQHPNVVPVYDFVERDGLFLMIMELVDGGTFGERLAGGGVTAAEACRVVAGVLDALHYAHDRGVVHRDVKPDNILIAADGTPKLGDFGIAKIVGSSSGATAAGAVMGTPAYMAPEVAMGEEATAASDVYSCAAVLYEALSGSLPHPPAATATATLVRIVNDPPRPLLEVAPRVDSRLEQLVMRALSKAPAGRPASAAEFAAELRQVSGSASSAAMAAMATVAPRGVPKVEAPAVASRGSKRWLVAVAAVVAVLGGVVAVVALGSDDAGSTLTDTLPTDTLLSDTLPTATTVSEFAPATTGETDAPASSTSSAEGPTTTAEFASTYAEAVAMFKFGCDAQGVSEAQCECMINGITDQLGPARLIRAINVMRAEGNSSADVTDIVQDCIVTVD